MTGVRIINNHMVFDTPAPEKVKAFFPDVKMATTNGVTYCAVPHTISSVRLFRNIGRHVDSPIRSQYQWPGRYDPYPHQIDTADFLSANPRAFCLNGMGSMKTVSSIWATDFLMQEKEVTRTLIAAPLSTLERVWGDELFFTLPTRKFAVLHGSRAKRLKLLAQPHDYYIINHDGLDIIADVLAARPDINHIIIDEVAVFRNKQTKRWKVMNEIINKQGIPRTVWGLTGTPTPNAPTDAYAQSKLIVPETCKSSFVGFRSETMFEAGRFRWLPKKGSESRVNEVLKPSIRFALEDCVSLPPTIHQDRESLLSKEQEKHYKELLSTAVTTIKGSEVTAVNAAVLINKLIQAACGVVYASDGTVVEMDFGPRLSVLMDVIEECNEKVIVFVPLTGVLDALKRELSKHWSVAVIDGSVSSTKRNDIFHRFQSESKPHILLANAGTMAHGLNLTAASTIVWYAPTNNNDTYGQANARIVRPGQTNVTNIVHLHATPVERKTYKALQDKTKLQDIVLDLARMR